MRGPRGHPSLLPGDTVSGGRGAPWHAGGSQPSWGVVMGQGWAEGASNHQPQAASNHRVVQLSPRPPPPATSMAQPCFRACSRRSGCGLTVMLQQHQTACHSSHTTGSFSTW